jgi:hypothetical protein
VVNRDGSIDRLTIGTSGITSLLSP